MNTNRPIPEMTRFANLDRSQTEVLGASDERSLLQELVECRRKLAMELSSVEGVDLPPDASPQTTAQFIASVYAGNGPDQGRLGPVYRRYSELRGKLALANLKLVAHVAKRFRERGIPYADLLQEGFCGLLEAIDRFDTTHQTKLATYATWWIRQAIQRAVASGAYPVRLTPRHLRQLAQESALGRQQQHGTDEPELIESALPVRSELISRIHAATRPTISLDASRDSNSGFNLLQSICDPAGDRTIDVETDETIEKLLQLLRPREQLVLSLRFGLEGRERLSLTQVGKILEVSKESARQIEARALSRLRASIEEDSTAGDPLALPL